MTDDTYDPADDPNEPRSRADELVDDLMPEGFEWRRLTTTYPRTALTVALAGGFLLGRTHGGGLLSALVGFAVGEVSRNLQGMVDDLNS